MANAFLALTNRKFGRNSKAVSHQLSAFSFQLSAKGFASAILENWFER
jgi:hypothetical protein